MKTLLRTLLPALLLIILGAGCASRAYVEREIDAAANRFDERSSELEAAIERTQTRLAETDQRLSIENGVQDERLDTLSETAREALERALAAGKLAEGKLLFESVLTDDQVRFGFDQASLSNDARQALDELGQRLKAENQEVYLEIQGHTDATGSEDYNLRLGEQRATEVLRYLNLELGIPLHRMAKISYGERAPVADNGDRDGRAQNRRVVVVVLR